PQGHERLAVGAEQDVPEQAGAEPGQLLARPGVPEPGVAPRRPRFLVPALRDQPPAVRAEGQDAEVAGHRQRPRGPPTLLARPPRWPGRCRPGPGAGRRRGGGAGGPAAAWPRAGWGG